MFRIRKIPKDESKFLKECDCKLFREKDLERGDTVGYYIPRTDCSFYDINDTHTCDKDCPGWRKEVELKQVYCTIGWESFMPKKEWEVRLTSYGGLDNMCSLKRKDLFYVPTIQWLIDALGNNFDRLEKSAGKYRFRIIANKTKYSGDSPRLAFIKAVKRIGFKEKG